jgi:hypothetical protein
LPSLFTPDPNAKTVTDLTQLACDVSTQSGRFSGAYSSSGIAAGNPQFPVPVFLFASQGSKSSNRPVETITPLSIAVGGLEINSKYPDQCYGDLATAILGAPATYGGKAILIAWHHGHAPDLAHALGVPKSELKPWDPWKPTVFDLVFKITWNDSKKASLVVAYQELLFGDTPSKRTSSK